MYIDLKTAVGTYRFTLYPIGTLFNHIAGIYAFLKFNPGLAGEYTADYQIPTTGYQLLYIGITHNFNVRLGAHHKMAQALELGMTHIGILRIRSGRKRKSAERQLLKTYNPPLNQTWHHQVPIDN